MPLKVSSTKESNEFHYRKEPQAGDQRYFGGSLGPPVKVIAS